MRVVALVEGDGKEGARQGVAGGGGRVNAFEMRLLMYHGPCEEFGELCSRSCEVGARRISEVTQFFVRKGFG